MLRNKKKNPKTKVLPLSRERMVVIKEWYGVCFPPMQFHDWKQFMIDDDENYGEIYFGKSNFQL